MQTIRHNDLFTDACFRLGETHAARFDFPLHGHDGLCEIVLVAGGRLSHRLRGEETLEQGPASLVLVRETDRHALLGQDLDMLNLAFPTWWLEELGRLWDSRPRVQDLLLRPRPPLAALGPDEARGLRDRCLALERDRLQPEARMRFSLLLAGILADHLLPLAAPAGLPRAPGWLADLVAWAGGQAATPGLAQLQARAGCSREHLARSFRRHLGTSPSRHLNRLRLLRARERLRTSRDGVLQASLEAGFDNPAYFHRLFRREFGTTPAAWRRSQAGGRYH